MSRHPRVCSFLLPLELAEVRKKFKTGISIGLKLDYKIIKEIIEGPTLAYLNEYQNVNRKLDSLSGLAADFLEKKGYNKIIGVLRMIEFMDII